MSPTVITLKPNCLVLLGSIYTTPNKVCTVTRRRYYSTSGGGAVRKKSKNNYILLFFFLLPPLPQVTLATPVGVARETSNSDSQLPTAVPILTFNNLNNEDSIKYIKGLLKYKRGIYSFINCFSLECILFFAYYSFLLFNPSPEEVGACPQLRGAKPLEEGTSFYYSNSQSSDLQPNMKQNNNSKASLVP
jgi:hypothetical protein